MDNNSSGEAVGEPAMNDSKATEPPELKPCPLCNCKVFKERFENFSATTTGELGFSYRCPKCRSQFAVFGKSEIEAMTRWGTRADTVQPSTQLDAELLALLVRAALPLEVLFATECDDAAIALSSELKTEIKEAVLAIRARIVPPSAAQVEQSEVETTVTSKFDDMALRVRGTY